MSRPFLVSIIILLIAFVTFLALPPKTPLSPLGSSSSKTYDPPTNNYITLGFAPYWNLKKLSPESLSGITHFAYFALHLNESGGIYTHVNRREQDPGYTNYQRLLTNSISKPEKPLILTFMPIDQDSLVSILSSTSTRQKSIQTMISSIQEIGAVGVNVDFEPVGEISTELRNNFTLLIKEFHTELNKLGKAQLLTISVYPSAAVRPRIWDLKALAPYTNYFVVMTYDYTMPKSTNAGPNSPLRDIGQNFEHNIIKNIAEFSNFVKPQQLLLGIPFYGYEWDTVDNSKYSPTINRGATASLERIEKLLQDKTLELLWDRNSLTPYGVSTESGTHSQIYFENDVSLKLKLEFVKTAGLGGIALWALGYDNNVPWLWPTLQSLNR